MSFTGYKLMHTPTGIENCASGFITDSSDLPNLIVSAANIIEVYIVRIQDDRVSLELACHYRLHGNVESMGILHACGVDGGRRRNRDSILLTFLDAKVSVLEFDDSMHGLRTSSMHCFEGPEWLHLKRGRECFARGPLVKVDPQGRCAGIIVYGLHMIMLKASEGTSDFAGEENSSTAAGLLAARIESSYIIHLRELGMRLVKDFVFIYGYIEPVMVILHEQGRVLSKHHMISAFSVSTTLKQHPLIWSGTNLPHDAYKLLAVPAPIGGVLVLCANTVHYRNQSVSLVLAVNNFAVPAYNSQEMQRASFNVELDAAQATWLTSDVAILSTKTGELLLLTLVYDGRTVHRLDLSKSRPSVLTSAITTIGNSFCFLGSRLGDSLLVQFEIKEEVAEGDIPSAKRMKRSSSDALEDIANHEELSFCRSDSIITQSYQKTFSFSVKDSLINVGPLKDLSYGLRVNADQNLVGVAKQLVCCSDHGKNGSLRVLQRSIQPETIALQESLPGCKGIWAVYHKSTRSHNIESSIGVADNEYHAYLVISLESRTIVMTANNLEEVTENVEYYTQGPTIAAGNLFGRRRVIQVYARGARVLDGAFMTQDLNFKLPNADVVSGAENATILSVCIADPYVLLRMVDGSIQLLVGDPSSCTVSVSSPTVFEGSQDSISACTLYHDKGPMPWLRPANTDAWFSTGAWEAIDGAYNTPQDQGDVYCLICYESGALEIFHLPNFGCVFKVGKFVSGRTHLIDSLLEEPTVASQKHLDKALMAIPGSGRKEGSDSIKVVELAMQKFSGKHSRPILFGILSDGTILCYHAYNYEVSECTFKLEKFPSSISASRLRNLRFVRIPLDLYAREEMLPGSSNSRITMFNNIGGCQGLFFCGSYPVWFMLFRERIRMHPQICDGPIVAFTDLHNVNCNHGFIYVTAQGSLKICQLNSQLSYDNHWPVQKIPVKGTPHQVTYFADKNLYSLIVSVPVTKPGNQVRSSLVDEKVGLVEHDMISLNETHNVEEFEVRILEPDKTGGLWQTRAIIPMQSSENALTVRVVTLFNTTKRENETLLAIGTAYVQGEDVAARGRILLCSIEKSSGNTQTSVSEVYSKEFEGAISAVTSIQGHLLIASGGKIILHRWTGSGLDGVALYDVSPLHVVSLNIVKNYILLGDIHKSIYFLSWKEQDRQLTLLAKDFESLNCLATEFLIDGSTLGLLVSDDQKNVKIFHYAPKISESWKGQKLLSRAEFHVGSHITKFMQVQLPAISDRAGAAPVLEKRNHFGLLFGTLDGSIRCIAPLDELTFRRLHSLERKLVGAVHHVAGLNPKSFRQFQSKGKAHRPGPDGMIDFELLFHYEMLSLEEQMEIARQAGTTRKQVISNLNDLALSTSFL